jgi:RNA polymerase sigma-70 factor (ECF subfamily)
LTDIEIIELYSMRCENAIEETQKQYASYCTSIAMGILHNKEDVDECLNDTYLSVWNSIPPQKPTVFSAFIGRITRNLALDRYRKKTSQKRGGDNAALLFSELEAVIPSSRNVENEVDLNDLSTAIEEFLKSRKKEDRVFFVSRYWYAETVPEIAVRFNTSVGKVTMSLHRTRKKLKTELEKRGFTL